MNSLLLSIALATNLTCEPYILKNTSGEAWNDKDQAHINVALKRCATLYKNSPCLKVFTKKAPKTYTAVCGK